MTRPYYPAFNNDGWVIEPNKMLDALISDFYVAEFSQDYVFARSVTSFPKILETYGGDIPEIANQTRGALTKYLQKYFDILKLEVIPLPSDSDSAGVMSIYIEVTRDGETTNLRNLLRIEGTRLQQVKNILDGPTQ